MRFVAGLATLLSVLGFATGAFGHASLVSTEPSDGSMMSSAPKTVRLRLKHPPKSVEDYLDTLRAQGLLATLNAIEPFDQFI